MGESGEVESASTATEGPVQATDGSADRRPRRPSPHPAAHGSGLLGLAVGALGVVYGDIGTSPLYALKTVFAIDGHAVQPTRSDVYGVISMVFWAVTLIVSIKYVAIVLRADNDGKGGVLALAALTRRAAADHRRLARAVLLLGVVGAALFYGDSLITPAISVLSAVEGLGTAAPSISGAALPLAVTILALLFLVQRWGTHRVGRAFGPIMIVWFLTMAVTALPQIARRPSIFGALSPVYVATFVTDHPYLTFVALGAVVLAITGAEALFADVGHFGRRPIRCAWFALVFPCLVLSYLGQGALVLDDPRATGDPFFLLVPGWGRVPMVILATAATVIASQAVISGAYSVSRQAVRFGFLQNLTVRHTSSEEAGQIYVPAVNWVLFAGVLIIVITFGSSSRLATAYGVAVTGTFLITTTLLLILAATAWHWSRPKLAVLAVVFGVVESAFFVANLTKVVSGGWLPLLVAAAIATVMTTWYRGQGIVRSERTDREGELESFVRTLPLRELRRVRGVAVYPHMSKETVPLALRANVAFNRVLHEHVLLVTVRAENVPYIPPAERSELVVLESQDGLIAHLDVQFGFQDDQDIPATVRRAVRYCSELDFDPDDAIYFLSRIVIRRGDTPRMARWRKWLFIAMAHNAASPVANFHLPDDRTVVIGEDFRM